MKFLRYWLIIKQVSGYNYYIKISHLVFILLCIEESLDESVRDCQELVPVKLEESLDNWTFLKQEPSDLDPAHLPDIKDGDGLLKDDTLALSCLPKIHANSHFSTEIYLAAISIGMAAWDRGLLQGPDTADFTMGLSEALYKIGRNVNRTGQWPL